MPRSLVPAELVEELAGRIESLHRPDGGRVIVGIAGAPGAGKSTLAEAVVARLAGRADWRGSTVAHVPMDGFHLADRELGRLGLRSVKGAPATFDAAGYAALLARIAAGEEVVAPAFERDLEQPVAGALPVTADARSVITEGNYLLLDAEPWRRARSRCTEVWAVTLDEGERLRRLIARHERFGKTPAQAREWVYRSDEANAALITPSLHTADLVIRL